MRSNRIGVMYDKHLQSTFHDYAGLERSLERRIGSNETFYCLRLRVVVTYAPFGPIVIFPEVPLCFTCFSG